jgi:hypothetical protein
MIRRTVLSTLLLGAAAVGPVVLYSTPGAWDSVRDNWFSGQGATAADGTDPALPPELSQAEETVEAIPLAIEGSPTRGLDEVLRFDVNSHWILQRWPRVSTGLAKLELQGYRVPLVTGTAETDLAGSLTYYFNPQQQVQRITFHGMTGNARELVRFLTSKYKFTRRLTNSPALVIYERASPGGHPTGELKMRPASVLKSNEPRQRFQVELTMERPA